MKIQSSCKEEKPKSPTFKDLPTGSIYRTKGGKIMMKMKFGQSRDALLYALDLDEGIFKDVNCSESQGWFDVAETIPNAVLVLNDGMGVK